jgi:hypothetical protein
MTKTMTGYVDLDDGKLYYEMASAPQQGDTARASELQIRIWVDGPYHQPEQINLGVRQRAADAQCRESSPHSNYPALRCLGFVCGEFRACSLCLARTYQ